MAQRRRFQPKKKKQSSRSAAQVHTARELPVPAVRREPVVYGKPFTVLEDADKNTFYFKAGAWIPYSASIAECRQTCKVKELPQRVNQMIRYEIRCPQEAQS
jgi:hypothetical protein